MRQFTMARVEFCRFLRLGCTEDDHPLFRREYARYGACVVRLEERSESWRPDLGRNNRERGVKVLYSIRFLHAEAKRMANQRASCVSVASLLPTLLPGSRQEKLLWLFRSRATDVLDGRECDAAGQLAGVRALRADAYDAAVAGRFN